VRTDIGDVALLGSISMSRAATRSQPLRRAGERYRGDAILRFMLGQQHKRPGRPPMGSRVAHFPPRETCAKNDTMSKAIATDGIIITPPAPPPFGAPW
jgi:hypothetical protein